MNLLVLTNFVLVYLWVNYVPTVFITISVRRRKYSTVTLNDISTEQSCHVHESFCSHGKLKKKIKKVPVSRSDESAVYISIF